MKFIIFGFEGTAEELVEVSRTNILPAGSNVKITDLPPEGDKLEYEEWLWGTPQKREDRTSRVFTPLTVAYYRKLFADGVKFSDMLKIADHHSCDPETVQDMLLRKSFKEVEPGRIAKVDWRN